MRHTPGPGSDTDNTLAPGHTSDPGGTPDPFDPERFRIEAPAVDPLIEVIAVDEVIPPRDRITGRFSLIPLSAVRHFPPTSRVLLLLAHAAAVGRPDLRGGWYKLATGLSTDFHLRDKDVRRRALATLEETGIIEVRRETGKSPLIRLAPKHHAAFQYVSSAARPPRAGTGAFVRCKPRIIGRPRHDPRSGPDPGEGTRRT